MEKWHKPVITELDLQSTEGGCLGGNNDGVMYSIQGRNGKTGKLIGTSGPSDDVYDIYDVINPPR